MKHIVLILILLFIIFPLSAQDIILKNNGEEISANVLEITPELVKYKEAGWSGSPLFSIYIKDINKITFSDGHIKIFNTVIKKKNIKKENITYTITDNRDGKEYKIVTIGKQDWFAENLSYKSSSSWNYEYNDAYSEIYGRLYFFEDAKNVCPDGWHLPSDKEWQQLELELGMIHGVDEEGWRGTSPGQGRLLKKGGDSNFNAVFSGFVLFQKNNSPSLSFSWKDKKAFFWTKSEDIFYKTKAWARLLDDRASIKRFASLKNYGYSVRCVKDN